MQRIGAHLGSGGCGFRVWAPNAERVSIIGDFNNWDGRHHVMRKHPGNGIWDGLASVLIGVVLLGVAVFLINPQVVAWAVHGHGTKLGAAMYLPWLVGWVLQALQGRGARAVGMIGLLLGFQILPLVTEGGWYNPNNLMLLPPSAFFLIGFMIWAPLLKSPNCASHRTSVSGSPTV